MNQDGTATIIMIRYNQPEAEENCLRSVRQHTDLTLHTLVTQDNYQRDKNLGALWNELIRKYKTEYICLLNSDTEVEQDWLTVLIQCAQAHEADAIGPMTDGAAGTPLQKFGNSSKGDCVETQQISGFCLLIRRDAWKRVGGFREDFTFYGGESNFLSRIGTKVICRDVVVKHTGSLSARGSGRLEELRELSTDFWTHNKKFDWTKRIAILGSDPGNPFPLWAGIDDAVREFKRQSTPIYYRRIPTEWHEFQTLFNWAPDVLIVVTQRPLPPDFKRWLSKWQGPAKGLWFNDLRRADHADLYTDLFHRIFLCFNHEHKDWEARAHCPIQYMPQGSRIWPELGVLPKDLKHAIFIGSIGNSEWHNGRAEVVHTLRADVLNQGLRPDRAKIEQQTPVLYRQYRYCLSMSPVAQGYQSLRLYNILAYGGLALQREFPGRNKLFHTGRHLIVWTPDELATLHEALQTMDLSWDLESIRRRGWRLSQAKHTGMQRLMNMTASLLTTDHSFWGYL